LVKVRPFFRESAENDFLPLWLGPERPCLESVSLSSITKEWTVIIPRSEGYSLRFPRAPPFPPITL
jgi:hypothetical protein